jgi:predicted ATP-dependent endonuclease of OLD family
VALHASLRKLGSESSEQVLISSHSPHFVSKQISHLERIIRLERRNGETKLYQITQSTFDEMIDKNVGLYKRFCDCLQDSSVDDEVKRKIRNGKFGDDDPDPDAKLEDEAVKYFLWLDSERASMFFAKKVIICEGASEKIFIDYLFDQLWPEFRDSHIYLLDALGKFNIHRYMTLLSALGIEHSILMDSDRNSGIHAIVNSFLEERKTEFTKQIHAFESDFEDFLGITKPSRNDLKPLNVIVRFQNEEIPANTIDNLKGILEKL